MASLEKSMRECEQMKGLSVYDHGKKVLERFEDLIGDRKLQWKLPSWFPQYEKQLFAELPDIQIMKDYLLYHDCGKPFCKTVDSEGKVHFPNHAQVSKEIWTNLNGPSLVADLIGQDMDIHILKPEGIPEFAGRPTASALLIAGLSEIHANAELFGGIESTGFKIKLKHLESRGKQICKIRYGEQK